MDHYSILGVSPTASTAEIRAAWLDQVKRYHPDTGSGSNRILLINAAWEVLGDPEQRHSYDRGRQGNNPGGEHQHNARNARASWTSREVSMRSAQAGDDLAQWLQAVYIPVDRLIGDVLNPFQTQLRALSADPYDDALMQDFCHYLDSSRQRLEKINVLYRSLAVPYSATAFGLSLYHCFSQVEDALTELERYTMGYVDGYLHDGREMLRNARQRRRLLQQERRRLEIR